MKKIIRALIFFVGWVLSPFTLWNDTFVNIPLSYIIANLLLCVTRLPFIQLLIGAYLLTNIVGIFFMYFSGKSLILSSRSKVKATIYLIIIVVVVSVIMIYLDREGKLLPLGAFFEKHCVAK